MQNDRLDHKLESRLPGKISTSDMQMIPLYGKKIGNKELPDEGERGEQ